MKEQELRQALGAMEVYKAQLEGIGEQQQLIQMSIEELSRAKVTLTDFIKSEVGDDVLIPVGSASFVKAKVSDNKNALIGVGTGITMEKPIEDAMVLIEKRLQEMLDAGKKLHESRQIIEMKAAQLNQVLEAEYQRMGGAHAP
jgi:prefoldin alpha subunit